MAQLREASPNDPITTRALDGIEMHAPILEDCEFYTRGGDQDRVKKSGDSGDTNLFRSENEDNGGTPRSNDYVDVPKKIISYDARADVILEDRNQSPEEELADQTFIESKQRSYLLQEKFFEADSGTNSEAFDGLRATTPASNVIEPDDKIVLPLGGDSKKQAQQEAIEKLLNFFGQVPGGASHAYMNVLMRNRLLTVAKHLGYYRQTKDDLGNVVDVVGDTIVRSAGRTKDGSAILPFSESFTDSNATTHNDTSSVFAVRWGERVDLSVLTSVGLKGRYAGQDGNQIVNNMNMDAQLVLQDDNALYQHRGFALTA